MDVPLLEELQSKFKCTQCGKCCAVGGDMDILVSEVPGIAGYLRMSVGMFYNMYIGHRDYVSKVAYFRTTCPCHFLDKFDNQCLIHECRPQACRDYPFMLYARGGCNLDAVLTCPVAVKMLEDHLKGVE
jgi:Fe-S-cluster containining protein